MDSPSLVSSEPVVALIYEAKQELDRVASLHACLLWVLGAIEAEPRRGQVNKVPRSMCPIAKHPHGQMRSDR